MKKLLAMCLSLAMLLTATVFVIPAYADDEEATIEIWIAQADWADAWDEMKEKFEEEHPNITIEDAGIQDDAGTFLSTRLAADNLPDVIQANMTDTLIKLVEGGKIVDAGKYEAAANIPDAYKENYTIEGTLAGFSQGAAFTAMYYNMQILNEAGWEDIPKNWDEFIQCCKDIQEKTDAAPLVLAGAKLTCVFMPLELLVANYVVGDDYAADQYETDFKEGKFDWTAYPILAEKLEELNPFFMEGSSSLQEEDTFTAMADGDAAMCLAGNWNATSVCEAIEECTGDPEMAKASLPPFAAADAEAIYPAGQFVFSLPQERCNLEFIRCKTVGSKPDILPVHPDCHTALGSLETEHHPVPCPVFRQREVFHIACYGIEKRRNLPDIHILCTIPRILGIAVLGMPVSFHLDMGRHRNLLPAPAVIVCSLKARDHLLFISCMEKTPGTIQAHPQGVSVPVRCHMI